MDQPVARGVRVGSGAGVKVRDQGRFVPGVHASPHTEIRPRQHISRRTEIRPGERRGMATEFTKGQPAHNHLAIGTVTIRVDKNGVRRAWIKIAEPNKWRQRAVAVWERANGRPLPRGMVVHHKDRDALNDELPNLAALTRREHVNEHRDELLVARWEAA